MVLKRKNKVPKRLKKGMRGGIKIFGYEFEFFNSVEKTNLANDESILTLINQWTIFIHDLGEYYFSLKRPECKTDSSADAKCEENISKEEFDESLSSFLENIEIIKAGKQNAFKPREKVKSCDTQTSDNPEQKKEIIRNFDEQFLKILNIVKTSIENKTVGTPQYNTMIGLVGKLPNINDSLIKLTAKNINNLEERYRKILEILGSVCSGFTAPFCSGAAKLLGKEVSTLYSKLKENSKENPDICESILIGFIKDVLPIMITKLKNINEFEDAYRKLILINNENVLGLTQIEVPVVGGKKSSRATHKEIQGRLMKIYRKPNDKKDYVKHKGVLISTKEYKEHMKQRAAITKKLILGKERCIYKVQGSNKEHVKYKGSLIPVADFKKLMKA